MQKKLFLLDGMALVYRAHFALIARPIFTSKGVNTSALYGFTQTLLEILRNQQPTHIAVAFDTEAPTHRHAEFSEYKATRQAMPEDLSRALPDVRRMLEAFRIPILTCDGYEADDIIATLVGRAERQGFKSYMVTPDKDFGQLVTESTILYKPARMGDAVEIMGPSEICARWGIQKTEQVIDLLALMGDTSDNIPGVPGIGEKTASKLVSQYSSVENVLKHAGDLKGKLKENLEKYQEQARLSKRLATLICDAPCDCDLDSLKLRPPDEEALKKLFVEFEFNSIGRRLFGDDFKAGRGYSAPAAPAAPAATGTEAPAGEQPGESPETVAVSAPKGPLKSLADVPHDYRVIQTPAEATTLLETLRQSKAFALKVVLSGPDPKDAILLGMAFSLKPGTGAYLPLSKSGKALVPHLEPLRAVLESEQIGKVGHNLKSDLLALKWKGFEVSGSLFDSMIAHSLLEPDMRHSLEYLAEAFLGYTPMKAEEATAPGQGQFGELLASDALVTSVADRAIEAADLAFQLQGALEPLLKQKSQERVFFEIESPLVPVLASMEHAGIRVDSRSLAVFAAQLEKEITLHEKAICQLAGTTFNLNSPKQLGQILFDVLKIGEAPKKTRTGQYVTDEQTLAALAPDHEIVRLLLEYRAAAKLKSTYADALPAAIWPRTGRIHTTYNQVMTATGRLNSQNPNLQNIPIRTELGQEIRKAFVPRDAEYLLLSADYSQIELRIIAALSREPGLLEAFRTGVDVHTATAARVFGVPLGQVTPEMRRKAKMVNYGIAYGISAFGLAQRLAIPRREASEIIDEYFKQFSRIRNYMDDTIAFARKHGYVETVTGRRRYIRDINSSNATVRGGAERNAINAPIQGSAADMIKLAMINIYGELRRRRLRSQMLLQVHDELVFDLFRPEEARVREIVSEKMRSAISLDVPIEVEIGVGENWLEAH